MSSDQGDPKVPLPLGVTSLPRDHGEDSDSDNMEELHECEYMSPRGGKDRLPEGHGENIEDSDTEPEERPCLGEIRENGKCEMEGVFEEGDERWPIRPTLSPPYTWICYLRSTFIIKGNEVKSRGTGCLFRPDSSTTGVILTCGHNLYTEETGEAIKIEVIRARDNGVAPFWILELGPECFKYPDEYKAKPTSQTYYSGHDYGMIMLPKEKRPPKNEGFGYAILKDKALKGRIIQVCGYPTDKTGATMHLSGGKVRQVSEDKVTYWNDTAGGQSGSPVWTWVKWNWMVVGVHGWYGRSGNQGCRLRKDMLRNIRRWAKELA